MQLCSSTEPISEWSFMQGICTFLINKFAKQLSPGYEIRNKIRSQPKVLISEFQLTFSMGTGEQTGIPNYPVPMTFAVFHSVVQWWMFSVGCWPTFAPKNPSHSNATWWSIIILGALGGHNGDHQPVTARSSSTGSPHPGYHNYAILWFHYL